jgi:hypothetical protein
VGGFVGVALSRYVPCRVVDYRPTYLMMMMLMQCISVVCRGNRSEDVDVLEVAIVDDVCIF